MTGTLEKNGCGHFLSLCEEGIKEEEGLDHMRKSSQCGAGISPVTKKDLSCRDIASGAL